MNETLILEIIFWSALFMVFYTYLGYGIVLRETGAATGQ